MEYNTELNSDAGYHAGSGLWKYCTPEQCREFILSLDLTGNMRLSDGKKLALLYGLSNHPQEHYLIKKIPKNHGGYRTLYVPDPVLKYVQRRILRRVLSQFPVSPCACAYHSGASVQANALPHTGKEKILKLDIHDFFGSISYISVCQHAFPGALFPPQVRTLLANLCCYDSMLPQGAPTSPYISNLVMKPFDGYMEKWCLARGIGYTRYCDDMTFSGSFNTREVTDKVRSFLLRLGFELNEKKTRVITRGGRQEVTGLVVNDHVQVSKAYRRRLRQEWYYIRKYGLKGHLERINYSKTEETYLASFSGKVNHVLRSCPEDACFRKIKQELSYFSAPRLNPGCTAPCCHEGP